MNAAPRRFSLEGRLMLLTAIPVCISVSLAVALSHWLGTGWLEWAVAMAVSIPLVALCVRWWVEPVLSLFRALSGAVASFRDRDFSFGLVRHANDELGDLVAAHNELAQTLRAERQHLFQRELLLDTVVQNTPVATAAVAAANEPEPDRDSIEAALARAGGVVSQAATDLGLSRQAFYRRMEKLGIARG